MPELLDRQLPIPDIRIQDRIARIDSDVNLLRSTFSDMQDTLDQDWNSLSDIWDKVDGLKAVLDIEQRIADWGRVLPYPLATIYRRYRVTIEPKERFATLLHFFEMTAIYLAAIGMSHVKVLRSDWRDVFAKWLHPKRGVSIERADFGFWINLAAASLKDINRVTSDKKLRGRAEQLAGLEMLQLANTIGGLSKAVTVFETPREYRNAWVGHGGHLKAADATRLEGELQQSIRDLYETTASILRRLQLVLPDKAEVTNTGFKFQIETLIGSDPTFQQQQVELTQKVKSNALAFWMGDARTMCPAVPLFRLGAPQRPQETSFYVFNRVEKEGIRWISYQEAVEQDFIAPDEELLDILSLRANT